MSNASMRQVPLSSLISFYPELPQMILIILPRHLQPLCGLRYVLSADQVRFPQYIALEFVHELGQALLLRRARLKGLRLRRRTFFFGMTEKIRGQIIFIEYPVRRNTHGVTQDMEQLAHVAGPVVLPEPLPKAGVSSRTGRPAN